MPILNYTTQIDSNKTVAEIQKILAAHGANKVSIEFDAGEPSAIYFSLQEKNMQFQFRLPCNVDGVYRLLRNDLKVAKRFRTENQARRVAWRIIKDWAEAQLSLIEANMAAPVEVFFPYIVTNNNETIYDRFISGETFPLLTD